MITTQHASPIAVRILNAVIEHEGWSLVSATDRSAVVIDHDDGGTLAFVVIRDRLNQAPGPELLTLDEYNDLMDVKETFTETLKTLPRRNDLITVLRRTNQKPLIRYTTHVALPEIH